MTPKQCQTKWLIKKLINRYNLSGYDQLQITASDLESPWSPLSTYHPPNTLKMGILCSKPLKFQFSSYILNRGLQKWIKLVSVDHWNIKITVLCAPNSETICIYLKIAFFPIILPFCLPFWLTEHGLFSKLGKTWKKSPKCQ